MIRLNESSVSQNLETLSTKDKIMTHRDEIESLVNNINMNRKMQHVNLKYECSNGFHNIYLYSGESCIKVMFVGNTKEIIVQLQAFRQGLQFVSTDYVN